MPQEIWAVLAITLVGGDGAAALNLAARRQREKDSGARCDEAWFRSWCPWPRC